MSHMAIRRQNVPQHNPTRPFLWGLAALAGLGGAAWYLMRDKKDDSEEDGESTEGGTVSSAAWETGSEPSNYTRVKVEKDYTTFAPSSYPNDDAQVAPSAGVQIHDVKKVSGGWQIAFTPLSTGLQSIVIQTPQGFANHALGLNVTTLG